MSVQKGTPVLWSVATTASATGLGTGLVQSVTFTPSATKTEIKGADGATKTEVYSNPMESITLEIIPTGTTSVASVVATLPEIGADLTVVDSVDTEIAGSSGTTNRYIVDSASKSRSVDSAVKLTVTAHRYTAGELTTIT